MTLDPQVRAYIDGLGAPPATPLPIDEQRAAYAASGPVLFGPVDPIAAVEEIEIPGPAGPVPVRLYRPHPADGTPQPALVYLHGGGWVYGDPDSHGPLCQALAARSGATVASVHYRLAPEHPFPAPLDDSWAAVQWAAGPGGAAAGIDPARIAVGGDSAGGALAAGCALRARAASLPLRLQLLLYPVTAPDFTTDSYELFSEGFGLTRAAMQWFWGLYAPGDAALDPEAAPLRAASLAGTAPAHVVTAEYDVLRGDGDAYVAKLAADGVPVRHVQADGMNHGFLRLPGVVDRAGPAVTAVAEAVAAALA